MQKIKSLGIMIYIDNSAQMLEDFSWIYKSWIYSGCWQDSDLIVVHHPDLADKFPKEPGVILIPYMPVNQPGSVFERYRYINSIACLSGEHIDSIALGYRYLLRTDADVFLTHHLANFKPSFPVHGRGLYHNSADFRENILKFCERYGVKHHNHFGCGHSLLAQAEVVVPFLRRQVYWCQKLIEDFGEDEANWGTWPNWFRHVSSMYAAEIAANESRDQLLRYGRERVLDVQSSSNEPIDALVLHIHAIHTMSHFSKFKYRTGEYKDISLDSLDRHCIGGYCHWLAAASIEQVKAEAPIPYMPK